jgi:hypothetical protein
VEVKEVPEDVFEAARMKEEGEAVRAALAVEFT